MAFTNQSRSPSSPQQAWLSELSLNFMDAYSLKLQALDGKHPYRDEM
jgi:hypothetical protein